MNVLFICRANAGRSQMAEAFFNSLTHSNDSTSAGVDLANSVMKNDLSVPPLVTEIMQEAGLDVSRARRKAVTEKMVEEADKVIVMMQEGEFPLPEYVEQSAKFVRWNDIPDAKGTDLAFHRNVRNLVEEKIRTLIA